MSVITKKSCRDGTTTETYSFIGLKNNKAQYLEDSSTKSAATRNVAVLEKNSTSNVDILKILHRIQLTAADHDVPVTDPGFIPVEISVKIPRTVKTESRDQICQFVISDLDVVGSPSRELLNFGKLPTA